MMSTRIKRMLRGSVVAACLATIGCTCTLVYAEPSTGELENTTSGLQGELNNLNNELGSLSSDLDSISGQMEETAAAMQDTQQRMTEAQQRGEEQYAAMKLRIKYMYETGNASFIEMLCSAESMTDFLNKSEFIQNVSEYDREMLQELQNTQNEIAEEGQVLEQQQASLAEMQQELNAKRASLESQISSTSSELSQYQAQLDRARAAEQLLAQQNAAAQTATADGAVTQQPTADSSATVASGGEAVSYTPDVSTDGLQSLGSFKITHYCSCYYCCGSWGNSTSTGTIPTAGRTIAVDPSVIPYGSHVVINGHTYVAEDSGGAIKGNKIDIFVSDHATALASGVYYADVYLAN